MTARQAVAWRTWLAIVGLATLIEAPGAQYAGRLTDRYPAEWESDRFRVRRLVLAPGTQEAEPAAADSVLVFLTADLEGRMPAVEAVWLPSGPRTLENRGRVRFEATLIELKDGPAGIAGTTPPEARPSTDRVDVWRLIDNARVMVVKQRYAPATSVDPPHFHPQDTVVVYLNGGYKWLPVGQLWDDYMWPTIGWSRASRVSRGDMDMVPANTVHRFGNAGFDPLEFLVIVFK